MLEKLPSEEQAEETTVRPLLEAATANFAAVRQARRDAVPVPEAAEVAAEEPAT